jgi:branched-chain amino acid transport system substrate-binding protein
VRHLATAILSLAALLPLPAHAEILVGVAGPMSGANAVFGDQMKRGVDAAITAINGAGGINGEPLRAIAADDGCDTRKAFDVSKDLARQDVRVVIGHFCSGAMIAATRTYLEAGILAITPAATLPAVTEQSQAWNVIRLANRDDAQADAAVKRIQATNPSAKLAIVGDGQALLRGLVDRIKGQLANADLITIKAGSTDFTDTVNAIKADGATDVYLALSATDAGNLARALRDSAVSANFYGPDLLLNDVFWDKAGDAGEGTRVSFSTDPLSRVSNFKVSQAIPGDGPAEGATLPAYAAIEAFAAAARATDVNNGHAMADWLKGGATVPTILGDVQFDAKGDLVRQQFTWYRWSNGQFAEDTPGN